MSRLITLCFVLDAFSIGGALRKLSDQAMSFEASAPELSVQDWVDFLTQDTCRNSKGEPVPGDPYSCPMHSDLKPGEVVYGGFKYADPVRIVAINNLPRLAPFGLMQFVVFDFAREPNPAWGDGMGMFDLDDPHCKISGSLCHQEGNWATKGEVDIVDLEEATWDPSWHGVAAIHGTAHMKTKGYIGWTGGQVGSSAGSPTDAWLMGAGSAPAVDVSIWIYADASGKMVNYRTVSSWPKGIRESPLGQSLPLPGNGVSNNFWVKFAKMYMGEGKTFNEVMLSIHGGTRRSLILSCEEHIEVFLHSREYGLMSHQTWKASRCDVNPGDGNIGCDDNEKAMIWEPMVLPFDGEQTWMNRVACTRTVTSGVTYPFDPRALSQPSAPKPYPNTEVLDMAGYGNILLNSQFAWVGADVMLGWAKEHHPKATWTRVRQGLTAAAPYNRALQVKCSCNDTLTFWQDLDLDVRAPGLRGRTVDFGMRLWGGSPADLYLWQFKGDGSAGTTSVLKATPTTKWPDPSVASLFSKSTGIQQSTKRIRFQVYFSGSTNMEFDDLFLTRRD